MYAARYDLFGFCFALRKLNMRNLHSKPFRKNESIKPSINTSTYNNNNNLYKHIHIIYLVDGRKHASDNSNEIHDEIRIPTKHTSHLLLFYITP